MGTVRVNSEFRRSLDRRTSLGYQTNHLARLLEQALRERIARHGVVPGQFAQLLALYEEDGLTQNELCNRVRIDQSTMAHTLRRMERDGLVQRTIDPVDRRRTRVTLTDRTRELQPVLMQAAQDVNAVAIRGFSGQEAAVFMEMLTRLIDNLMADRAGDG